MGRFCFYMLIPIILTLFLIFLPFKHFWICKYNIKHNFF
jgi:hypothetical protein